MMEKSLLPIAELLPLRILVVSLRFLELSHPRFFHQAALTAFIRYLLDSPPDYAALLTIDCPESGRVSYEEGDYYRFTVIGLAGSERLLALLIERLQQLPQSAVRYGTLLPFCNNWHLEALHDALTHQPVSLLKDLSVYDYDSLVAEADLWSSQCRFNWQWLSPVRLLKNKARRSEKDKGDTRFCKEIADIDTDLLLSRNYDAIASLIRQRGGGVAARSIPPAISLSGYHLFWVDSQYSDRNGHEQPVGGVLGYLRLQLDTELPASWWHLLVLGQYLGIGQGRAFGLGRYQLVTEKGEFTYCRTLPALPLLASVIKRNNLLDAYWHTRNHSSRQALPADDEAPWPALQKMATSLLNRHYEVPALPQSVTQSRPRPEPHFALPPFWDAVMQRAVVQVLTPALNAVMHNRMGSTRNGPDRMNPQRLAHTLWREGYRWVYSPVKIDEFFESIDLQWLYERLDALFGDDPLIVQIMNWLSAPEKSGRQIHPSRGGLPRGSPLSRLLAQRLLEDIDRTVISSGLRLLNCRTGLMIMCKHPWDDARALSFSSYKGNDNCRCVLKQTDGLNWLARKTPTYFSSSDALVNQLLNRVKVQRKTTKSVL